MLKVMIAEDDLMMADMLEDLLVIDGYEVCGIANTVERAVKLCELHAPDLAILDLRLADGGLGTEIAARLNYPGRPGILYATGNGNQIRLTRTDGEACIGKPYHPQDVVRSLKIVEQIVKTGEAPRPFPKGFYLLDGELKEKLGDGEAAFQIIKLRRQQAELAKFGSFALSETDLKTILTEAARVCAECLGVPFCKVCRYRHDENDLLVEAGVGWNPGVVGGVVSRADNSSPQGRAFITGEPVICSDLAEDRSFLLPAFYAEHRIISTIDVIIKRDGVPYGVLEIDSPVQQNYDEHDVVFLTGFANVLAEAVDTSKRNSALQAAVDRMQDMVTEKDRLLATQKALLDDKNVLAQELQHRVRNNLQLVYGMLNKQLLTTLDESGKEGIGAIARRVMTLAQVYDHLLGTGLSRTIDFGGYLASLCSNFEDLEKVLHPNISLTCQREPIILDLDTVTSLGLVVSELISNSFAHAFPAGGGTILVTLTLAASGKLGTIVFADDGIGFTDAADSKRHGVGLVRRLVGQINGTVELISDHGTKWTFTFPVP
jgi:two-component sensor histidine kinase/DNA-binding response OmpR family regulator/putative methionine-R-sulfoxide reductase with GAF domain